MPAYLAALGLVPTDFTSKPNVVRATTNHTSPQVTTRIRNPTWSGGTLSTRLGSRPESGSGAVRGVDAAVSRSTTGSCELTSQRT